MVGKTINEARACQSTSMQGVYSGSGVKSFPRGDGTLGGGVGVGKATRGAVWGRFAGVPAWRWMQLLTGFTVLYSCMYLFLGLSVGTLAVEFAVQWFMNSGLGDAVELGGDVAYEQAFFAGFRGITRVGSLLCEVVGPQRLSVWLLYILSVTLVCRARERGCGVDLTISRVVRCVSMIMSLCFIGIGWFFTVVLEGAGRYVVSAAFVVVAVLLSLPVWDASIIGGGSRFENIVRLVFANILVWISGPFAVVVLMLFPAKIFSPNLPRAVGSANDKYWAQVYATTGLDATRIEMGLPTDTFSAIADGVHSEGVSPRVRMLALVGDRAMSLALARVASREGWTVEYYSDVSQRSLTNAAFRRFYDAHLVSLMPQLHSRSEKRVGTCVEALVGAYYEVAQDLEEIEKFVMTRVLPLNSMRA